MKIRQDFITNSSSSSFIVIDTSNGYDQLIPNEINNQYTYIIGEWGKKQFGWEVEYSRDIHSRINFCYIQAMSIENQEWLDMLEKVIKENSEVRWLINELSLDYNKDNWAYIDHQSCATEEENIEMFENEQKLKDFIFGKDSYIKTDNDNY